MMPELVVNNDSDEEEDPFTQAVDEDTGLSVYAATKTVMGRNSADACFIIGGVPDAFPWLYLIKWRGSRRGTAITLFWPGVRVEVEGENLSPVHGLLMQRRASIWRCFNPKEHMEPKPDEPRIFTIKIVADG